MKLSEVYLKNTECLNTPQTPETPGKFQSGTNGHKKPVFSIEIFPPKAASDKEFQDKLSALFKEINKINEYTPPSLVSITYGAGGSNREKSLSLLKSLKANFHFDIIMPHFTCVCSSKEFIEDYLSEIESLKINNILALRGDEPEDIQICYKDFKHAKDLVKFIKKKTSFEIAVAGYPEGHVLSADLKTDIKFLKEKIEAGGNVIFTQFFFENEKFYSYLESLEKEGIKTPVAAGILPVISYTGLLRMSKLSGVKLSKKMVNHFEKWQYSKTDTIKAGIDWATEQVLDLIKNEADGIHFYTLNKAHSTLEILKNVNFKD